MMTQTEKLDFVVGTLNQDTTGFCCNFNNCRTIGGVSFDGSANINLPGVKHLVIKIPLEMQPPTNTRNCIQNLYME